MLEGDDFLHPNSGGPHGWNSHASIDQVIAGQIGNDTAFRSLEFGVQTGGAHPGARIAYAGPAQPLAPEPNPFAMFDRIFGDGGVDTETAAKLKAERLGVIDAIKPELDTLVGKVAQNDRLKIEAHLAALEQMQQQFGATYTCMPPDLGAAVDLGDFGVTDVIARQQLDVLVEALACGVTNVASIMMRIGENDAYPYPFLGIPDEHHLKTHAGDSDTGRWDQVTAIERFYCEQLAYLASKLDALVEPDGTTVLDNTVVLWGSEIAKGNDHSFDNLPFVLLGGGGGALKTGRFVQAPGENHARMFVALCQAYGLDLNAFGGFDDGTGALTTILA